MRFISQVQMPRIFFLRALYSASSIKPSSNNLLADPRSLNDLELSSDASITASIVVFSDVLADPETSTKFPTASLISTSTLKTQLY